MSRVSTAPTITAATIYGWPPEVGIERRYEEQIEHGGGDQAAQYDDGQRVFDLVAWLVAADYQGQQGSA